MKNILTSFQLSFVNLKSNFFRTILSILGIVIGVASLVGILSLIDGMEMFARDQISQTTSLNAVSIQAETYTMLNNIRVKREKIESIPFAEIPALVESVGKPVTAYMRISTTDLVSIGEDTTKIAAYGFGCLPSLLPDNELKAGSIFTQQDLEQAVQNVVVNRFFLKVAKLDTLASMLGKSLTINGKEFKITGIVAGKRDNAPQVFYPVSTLPAQRLATSPPEVYLLASKVEDVPHIKNVVSKFLNEKFGKGKFTIMTNEFRVEQAAKGFLLFRVIMGLIVGISVLVGGIGVMNVLLISVTERTREIGIRKALGAKRKHIVMQFLSESITISAAGSILGFVLGVTGTMVIIPIVKAITKVPFQAAYTWNTLIIISIIAIVVGIVFGTYPALRASRLNPVDAIRHE